METKHEEWTPKPRFGSVASAMAALRPAAEAGDPKAMIGLALALDPCRTEPPTAADERWLKKISVQPTDEGYESDKAQRVEARRSFGAYCTISSVVARTEYRRWLLRAADAGDSEAQLRVALRPPVDFDYTAKVREAMLSAAPFPADLYDGEPRRLAEKYATEARDQGEALAATILASGEYVKPDADRNSVELYVNARLSDAAEAQVSGFQRQWGAAFYAKLESSMRPIDLEIARERVDQLLVANPVWILRDSSVLNAATLPTGDP